MGKRIPAKSSARRESFRRLERAAGDLNVVLLMFAIGLAALDATCFVTNQVVDHLPVTRIVYADAPGSAPLATDASLK